MKKILFTLALIIAAPIMANAQLGFTASYLNQTSTERSGDTSREVNYNGASVGLEFEIPVIGEISLVPGVNLSFLLSGVNEISLSFLSSRGQYKDVNINVPVEVRYDLYLSSGTDFFIYAGPTISYGLNAKYNYESSLLGSSQKDMYGEKYGRINIAANFGFGFVVFENIQGKLGYNLGLLDRNKKDDVKLTTSFLSVGVAYLF